jgi:hypothetical protein
MYDAWFKHSHTNEVLSRAEVPLEPLCVLPDSCIEAGNGGIQASSQRVPSSLKVHYVKGYFKTFVDTTCHSA